MSDQSNAANQGQTPYQLSAAELQKLVEKVYQLMLADLRIERERQGIRLRPQAQERDRL